MSNPSSPSGARRGRMIGVLLVVAVLLLVSIAASIWMIRGFFRHDEARVLLTDSQAASVKAPPAQTAGGVPIGGVIKNEKGEPVAGVRINLYWAIDLPSGSPAGTSQYKNGSAITDANGHWTFGAIPEGSLPGLSLELLHKDYVRRGIDSPGNAELLDGSAAYVISHGFDLQGRVVDAGGNAVTGVRVTAGYMLNDNAQPSARTDGSGHFVIHHLTPGQAQVAASQTGFAPAIAKIVAVENAGDVVLTLKPGGILRGRVVDQSGKSLEGVSIQLRYWNSENLGLTARSDATGRFKLADLPEGTLTISFSKHGYANPEMQLAAGQDEPVITVPLLPAFSGIVTDAKTHEPIKNFRAIGGVLWPGRRDPIFSFSGASAGRDGQYAQKPGGFSGNIRNWYVRVEADGYLPAQSPGTIASRDVRQDFELTPAPDIQIHVVDEAGKPVAGAEMMMNIAGCGVYVSQSVPSQREFAAQLGKTDADGKFSFHPQMAPFEIWAIAESGGAQSRFLSYGGGLVEMKLSPWANLRLHSLPAAGAEPIYIELEQAADPLRVLNFSHWQYNAEPDKEGVATFQKLPGTYPESLGIAQYYIPGAGPLAGNRYAILPLHAGQTTDMDLTPGVTVSGQFLPASPADDAGTAAGRLVLHAIPDAPPSQWPTDWLAAAHASPPIFAYTANTDAAGHFKIAGVASGKYEYSLEPNSEPELVCGSGVVTIPASTPELVVPNLRYSRFNTLKAGDAAPDVLGRTLDDKPIRAGDFVGKYVIWMAFDSSMPGCECEAPPIKAMAAHFANDSRVALVATNIERATESYTRPARGPPVLSQPGWVSGYLSLVNEPLLKSLDMNTLDGPKFFIVDPSGKIAAMNLQPEQMTAKLDELLANSRRLQ